MGELWKSVHISGSFNFDEWKSTQPGEWWCCCLQRMHPNARGFRFGLFVFVFKSNDHYRLSGVLKAQLMTEGNLFVLPSERFDAGAGTNQMLDHDWLSEGRPSPHGGNLRLYLMELTVTRETILSNKGLDSAFKSQSEGLSSLLEFTYTNPDDR